MWSKTTEGKRGRPPGPWISRPRRGILAYVAGLSEKHGVSPDRLLKKIIEARENEKSVCKTLTIQCRVRTEDYAVFRITRKGRLVAQLRIPNDLLAAVIDKSKVKGEKDLDGLGRKSSNSIR